MRKTLLLVFPVVFCIGCQQRAVAPSPHSGGPGTVAGVKPGATAPEPAPAKPAPPPPREAAPAETPRVDIGTSAGPQPERPRPAPNRSPASAAPQPAESGLQLQFTNWYQHLNQGTIYYGVPSTMYWREESTVTVVIAGPTAPPASVPNEAGSGQLKISDFMKVDLSCPDNPDEFSIVPPPGTNDVQFVAVNGSNTWSWTVTPRYTLSKPVTLVIEAWVIDNTQQGKITEQIPSYTASVRVHVPGLGESLKMLFEGDPQYWLRYGLPGGAGFTFVSGCVLWYWRRLHKKKQARRTHTAART